MSKITLYTMPSCPYCHRAKDLLKRRGIAFDEVVVDYHDDTLWDDLYKRSGMRTVPQIYVDGRCLGGYDDLTRKDSEDQLVGLKGEGNN